MYSNTVQEYCLKSWINSLAIHMIFLLTQLCTEVVESGHCV